MDGNKLLDLASLHIGEPYILGSMVPKSDVNYKGPWDCAEFTSWLVYQVSQKLYGCSNDNAVPSMADAYTGYWKRDADTLGKIVPVEVAAKATGAMILRYSGPGLTGHIVVSDGKGGTVEAHSHKDGVIESVVSGRRWDIGILIPWINYDFSPISQNIQLPKDMIYRWMSPIMTGDKIKDIQSKLGIDADGKFGKDTFYAVKSFQNAKGLVSDGEAGPKTLKALGL